MVRLTIAVLACLVAMAAANYYTEHEEPAYHEYSAEGGQNYQYDYDYDSTPSYGADPYPAPRRYSYGGDRRHSNYRTSYEDNSYGVQDQGGYADYYPEEQDYAPRRSQRGYGRRGGMDRYGRSGSYGYAKPKHQHVPVIIKKKTEKKRKTISVHAGFYIPGGTAIFGKFKDLKSCQKACEITPTCFAGDFNPWLSKCYMHTNLTACQSMRAHKQITHFKKVPCNLVETPRGLITLGAAVYSGLEQKHISNLMDCIKSCATAGGGIAPTNEMVPATPQLCFGIDYDFADHKCFFHVTLTAVCGATDNTDPITTPVTQYAKATSINILLCPLA